MSSAQKRGKVYYAKYKDASGTWARERTAYTKKADCERYAAKMEAMHHEVRSGLRDAPMDATKDFAWLHSWWWERYGKKHRARKKEDFETMFRNRVLRHLGKVPLDKVTPLAVLDALKKNEEPQTITEDGKTFVLNALAPKTLNHLRSRISTIIQKAAIRGGPWRGAPNPVTRDEVPRWKTGRKLKDTLRAEEVEPTVAALDPEWRALFVVAIWMGLRKGEIAALQKCDVRLDRPGYEEMDISRSWDVSTTKTDEEATLPIPTPVVPYLREAMARSRCELVFPAPSGQMMHEDTKLQLVLRRAMARAGFTKGWVHICRRCKSRGRPYEEQHQDSELRHCPECNMKLWPKPIHRDITFHGLRHTTATLLARRGVPATVAQRITRHADIEVLSSIYTQVSLDDMRVAMNRMLPQVSAVGGAGGAQILGPPVVQASETQKNEAPEAPAFAKNLRGFEVSGRQDLNLRPLGPEKTSQGWQGVAAGGSDWQAPERTGATVHALPVGDSPRNAKTEILGPPVVQKTRSQPGPTLARESLLDQTKVGNTDGGGR